MLCCVSRRAVAGADLGPAYGNRYAGGPLPVLLERVEVEPDPEEDAPPVLLPCAICARTFMPQSLEKHTRICERAAAKKRKPFDSAKQRIQGTELAEFLPKQERRHRHADEKPTAKSSWKQTHDEFLRAIRAARGDAEPSVQRQPSVATATSGAPTRANEKGACPTCNRQFGIKAYERHVAWCKERSTRLPASPATNVAKERLEARMKYRAPALKNRRPTNREKYAPGSALALNMASKASPTSAANRPKESASVPVCNRADSSGHSPAKQRPAVVRRSGQARENSGSGGPVKSRVADRTNRQTEVRYPATITPRSSRPASLIRRKPRRDIIVETLKRHPALSPSSAKAIGILDRPATRERLIGRRAKIDEGRPQVVLSARSQKLNIVSARSQGNPKLNDVIVNDNVTGMTVQPCRIRRGEKYVTWKQLTDKSRVRPCDADNKDNDYLRDFRLPDLENRKVDVAVESSVAGEKFATASGEGQMETKLSDDECDRDDEEANYECEITWTSVIQKLNQTYLIRDSSETEENFVKCQVETDRSSLEDLETSNKIRWKPIKHSPRVEFCLKSPKRSKLLNDTMYDTSSNTDVESSTVSILREGKSNCNDNITISDDLDYKLNALNTIDENVECNTIVNNETDKREEHPEESLLCDTQDTESLCRNIMESSAETKRTSNENEPRDTEEDVAESSNETENVQLDDQLFIKDQPVRRTSNISNCESGSLEIAIEPSFHAISIHPSRASTPFDSIDRCRNEASSCPDNTHNTDDKGSFSNDHSETLYLSCCSKHDGIGNSSRNDAVDDNVCEESISTNANLAEGPVTTGSKKRCGSYVIKKVSPADSSRCVSNESLIDGAQERAMGSKREDLEGIEDTDRADFFEISRRQSVKNDIENEVCDLHRSTDTCTDRESASIVLAESANEADVTVDENMMENMMENMDENMIENMNKNAHEIHEKYVNANFESDSDYNFGEVRAASCKVDRKRTLSDSRVRLNRRETARDAANAKRSRAQPSEMRSRIRRSMHLLRGSTDTLISSVEAVHNGDRQQRRDADSFEQEVVEEIGPPTGPGRFRILPEIKGEGCERKDGSERRPSYWERASKVSKDRLIGLDPPNHGDRWLPKRNPKVRILPPVPCNSPLIVRSGAYKDYDPFLLAEQQMNELLSDTSDRSITDDSSPPSHGRETAFPLSHSSAFAKYPHQSSNPSPDRRSSLIAPPTEFDDLTSDFSSDSTETNSLSREVFLSSPKGRQGSAGEPVASRSPPRELGRRVIIDKSKALGAQVADEPVNRGDRSFVGSAERARKILDKVAPKVARPAVTRSRSVRASSAPKIAPKSAPKPAAKPAPKSALDRKNPSNLGAGARRCPGPTSEQGRDDALANRRNNNYAPLSGSNLSLSSIVSSDADMKRSNSLFEELMSSFEDDRNSFPSFRSLLRDDPLSTSSPVHDGRHRNGRVSDEELSSPDSYKRQEHGKLSADSAYSSLNRKYSNHGRSANDVGRLDEDATRNSRRDCDSTAARCKMSKFCHECGSRFPETAKFCCECGVRRLAL